AKAGEGDGELGLFAFALDPQHRAHAEFGMAHARTGPPAAGGRPDRRGGGWFSSGGGRGDGVTAPLSAAAGIGIATRALKELVNTFHRVVGMTEAGAGRFHPFFLAVALPHIPRPGGQTAGQGIGRRKVAQQVRGHLAEEARGDRRFVSLTAITAAAGGGAGGGAPPLLCGHDPRAPRTAAGPRRSFSNA